MLNLLLLVLLAATQWALWMGQGGVPEWRELRAQQATQREENARLAERNAALSAEVRDLKQGLEAIEELARADMGMVREGETFYHVLARRPAPVVP